MDRKKYVRSFFLVIYTPSFVIPAQAGIHSLWALHEVIALIIVSKIKLNVLKSRFFLRSMDPRLRGDDKEGCGDDKEGCGDDKNGERRSKIIYTPSFVIPAQAGIHSLWALHEVIALIIVSKIKLNVLKSRFFLRSMDLRLRGDDKEGCGDDKNGERRSKKLSFFISTQQCRAGTAKERGGNDNE